MAFTKGHRINMGKECSPKTREKIGVANSKPKLSKTCGQCKKVFEVWPSRLHTKYCSAKCAYASRKGKPSWNKSLLGFRAGEKRPGIIPQGEKNGCWKGEKVGYRGLHIWVAKSLGKPKRCSNCGDAKGSERRYHWANRSQKYKRVLTDWIRLCAVCHKAYDAGKISIENI
jgi:hypothetical protein